MNVEKSIQLFTKRDQAFDFCRSFLVVSMIFTHVFQNFYLPDYNRRLTFFVTIGFVLISGFAIGGKNAQQVGRMPWIFFPEYLRRFSKILLIYLLCNVPIIMLEPSRLVLIQDTPIVAIIWMIVSGEGSAVFGFDILPAIALTTLFAWIVMGATNRIGAIALLHCLITFFLLLLFESFFGAQFIAIRLLFVGVFGCLLGKVSSHIDWNHFARTMSGFKSMVGLGIILSMYFLAIGQRVWPSGSILLWRHLIPTTLLLLFVYMFSYKFELGEIQWGRYLNSTLGNYMLFSYIFHIGLIKLARVFVDSDLSFKSTLFVGIIFTITTLVVCYFLDLGRKQVPIINRAYSAFLGL